MGGEAVIKYLDGEFEVVMPGNHVVCAVTGEMGEAFFQRFASSCSLRLPLFTAERPPLDLGGRATGGGADGGGVPASP